MSVSFTPRSPAYQDSPSCGNCAHYYECANALYLCEEVRP